MRPLHYGADADAKDVKTLFRVLHRVQTDPAYEGIKGKDKKRHSELQEHLKKAIDLLLNNGKDEHP